MEADEICEIVGVREYVDGEALKLVPRQPDRRVVLRAFNEGGNSYTDVDLFDLIEWLEHGPVGGLIRGDPNERD